MAKIVLKRYIELPTDIGEILWNFQQSELEKGIKHKYVRRIQNKTPPPKWRYFYDVGGGQGLGHHEEMKEGAKFKVEGGHYEIVGVDGDSVKIRHDETGEEKTVSKEKLKDILHGHHKERIKQRSENIKRLIVSAKKFGTKKQQERLKEKEKKEKELFGKKKTKKIKEKEDGKAKTETKTTRRGGKRVLGNARRGQKVAGQHHEKSVEPAPKGAPETTKTAAEIMNDPPTPITAEFALPDGQKVDIKPPSENPAIDLHPDLWPQIDELPKLPDDVIRFPNPAPLTTSEGKITGHIEQLYPHQIEGAQRVLYAWQKGDGMVLGDSAGLGKFQPIDSLVLTPHGWKKIGELKIKDKVIGSNGLPSEVLGVFPQGVKNNYHVTFSDGSSVEAGDEHLWTVAYKAGGRKWKEIVITTKQMREQSCVTVQHNENKTSIMNLGKNTIYLPMLSAPVEFYDMSDFPIDSYVLGQLIANGSCSEITPSLVINSADYDEIKIRLQEKIKIGSIHRYGNATHISIPKVGKILREFGLNVKSRDKFIPKQYLYSSIENRNLLLQGLMDGDGSCSKTRNRLVYHTTSEKLAKDVVELVQMLGGIASIRKYDRTHEDKPIEYQVRLRLPKWVFPFYISRKANRYNPGRFSHPVRTLKSVTFSRSVESICIKVAADDELYLTENCILTHNTNIAMAALVANKGKRNLIVVPVAGKEGLKAQWIGDRAAGLYNIDVKGAEVETTKRGREKVNFKSDELSSTEDGTYIVSYDELYETKLDENGDPVKDESGKTVKQLRKSLFDGRWDAVVFDESHTMQKQGGLFSTAGKDLADRADKALYLSATPYTNISDMHYLTKLGLFGNSYNEFKKWAELAGAKIDENKIRNPSSHLPMAAIAATLHVHGKSVKRSTSLEGVMSQFDQSLRSNLTPEQSEAFKTADRVIDMASEAINPEFLKALYVGWNRQYWELCKVDKAIEFGKKAIDEGKQVAFFTSYKAANHAHLRAIPKMLRNRADKLEASDNPNARAKANRLYDLAIKIDEVVAQMPKGDSAVKRLVDAFGGSDKVAEIHGNTTKKPHTEQESYQAGSKKVCVATMARGGTGISLHDTTGERPRVQVNLSLPWSGREFNQVAGRSHRLGSKSDTTMYWMVGDDSHEMHNGAVVAKRLQSMGSLTAGDPELTVDANNLLAWEFANNGPNSDDEKDFQNAIEQMDQEVSGDLPKDKEDQIKNAAISEHAQAARDYFREYAERIKAGGDVIRERYEEAKIRAEKKEFRESRRAAEQLRQYLDWSVHWRPYDGMWEIDKTGLGRFAENEIKKSSIAGKPKTYGGKYALSYQVHPDSMKKLAQNLGVSERKVDFTIEEYADPSKRSEVEKTIDELDKKKLRTKFWGYSASDEPLYLITGKTYDQRAALGSVGVFNRVEKGYVIGEDYLKTVLSNISKLGDYSEKMESRPGEYYKRPSIVAKPGKYTRHTHLAKGRFVIRNPLRG